MERLLNIIANPDKRHIWILNRKYCPHKAMIEGKAMVLYSYDPVENETPFSFDAISNIEGYNYKTSSASVPALCFSILLYFTGRPSWWPFWGNYIFLASFCRNVRNLL